MLHIMKINMLWKTTIYLAFGFALSSPSTEPNIATTSPISARAARQEAESDTISLELVFSSNEDFTDDLSNSNSQAFQDRVNLTKTQLTPVFQMAFSAFLQLRNIGFSGDINSEGESGAGSGEGSGGGSGRESKMFLNEHSLSYGGNPVEVLDPEEDIGTFDDEHIFSFWVNTIEKPSAQQVLNRETSTNPRAMLLVTTVEIVFNSSGVVPTTDQVVTALEDAINSGAVTIPIMISSISVNSLSSSGVSFVPSSVFSCFLLTCCSLLLAVILDFS
ncbi:hypothetical protein AAFF_G00307430 [Aldrovandia affinis]|uniref:SEA domain-containing protein n=1 Tax=Aldrovandia affinis TaxID=143900 RepID=A0AAD7R8H9_9TELE|nr:hypothetical protein AAFF_G00307430 [Aldrovandia affinis]